MQLLVHLDSGNYYKNTGFCISNFIVRVSVDLFFFITIWNHIKLCKWYKDFIILFIVLRVFMMPGFYISDFFLTFNALRYISQLAKSASLAGIE